MGNKFYGGQGYGVDAVRALCRFLFHRFRLRRIKRSYLNFVAHFCWPQPDRPPSHRRRGDALADF